MNGRILALCESGEQAELARLNWPEITIIAFTPAADVWRERAGCNDPTVEDLCDERRLASVGPEMTELIDNLADRVAALSKPLLGPVDPYGDLTLRGFFHFLRTHIDGVVIRVEQILAAIDDLRPAKIVAFAGKPWRMTGLTCLDKPVLGLTQHLLPRICSARGIEIVQLPLAAGAASNNAQELPSTDVQPHSADSIKKGDTPDLITPSATGVVARLLAALGLKRNSAGLGAQIGSQPVLLTSLFSDLGTTINDLWTAQGGTVIGIGDMPADDADAARLDDVRAHCGRLWDAVRADVEVACILRHKGVDLRPEMFAQIEPIICDRFPVMWANVRGFDNWFSSRRAVVLLGGVVDTHYVLARAAARHNVPIVSYHYGGFLGFSLLPIHERYDLAECDYFLCGGQLARDTFAARNPEVRWRNGVRRAVPVPLGAPWIADLLGKSRRAEPVSRPIKRVMLLLNALVGDCRYLGHVFPPEIEYWRFSRRLIRRLAAEPLEVIVKPPLQGRYPQQRNPVEDWLDREALPNVSVLREHPLAECLDQVDAFVLESPSTPLLQLMTTRAPLALYVSKDVYRVVPAARELLARRCGVFAENEADFFSNLDMWLADVRSGVVQTNVAVDDGFLEQVCTGDDASNTTDRIVSFLKSLYWAEASESGWFAAAGHGSRGDGCDPHPLARQKSLTP